MSKYWDNDELILKSGNGSRTKRERLTVMAQKREQKTELARPAQRSAVDDQLRALVRTLAKMAAEADYEASKAKTSHPPKGSSS